MQVISFYLTAIETRMREGIIFVFLAFRQRLIDARKDAKRANLAIFLVEENNGKAILRSMTELQPTVTFTMPVPYREDCAYTFANGKLHLQVVVSVGVQNHNWDSRLSLTQER